MMPTQQKLPKRISPQKVHAVLRKAGVKVVGINSWHNKTRLAVWPEWGRDKQNGVWVYMDQACKEVAAALTAAGIRCEVRDGAVWVPVDQAGDADS